MTNYPLQYEVRVESRPGVNHAWSGRGSQSEREMEVAIPPEFDGPGAGFSPEELYALSLANCFVATFKVAAERAELKYGNISITSKLTEDRDEAGRPWMSQCRFAVRLQGADSRDEAQRLLEEVSRECFILNSVRTEKVFEFELV